MDAKEQSIATYNFSAAALAEKFNQQGIRVADIDRAFSFINKENPRVLEIGCGNGRDATEITKRTSQYLGIDAASEMIKLAQDAVPSAKFELQDIESYLFSKQIDLIFSFASLLHSPREQLVEIFDRAYEALNIGGIFYISLKLGDYREELKADEFGTRIFYYYSPELIKELAGARFTLIWEDVQRRREKWFTVVLRK